MAAIEITRDLFEQQLEFAATKVTDPQAGLFGPDSMMWRISRHALFGAHGSGRALLLQIAHPWVTRGVDEHSHTRHDPLGRAKRTFTTVISIVYGNLEQAIHQARIVHSVHEKIRGKMAEHAGAFSRGSDYLANEANAMLWVHATLWDTSVMMHELFNGPLTPQEKHRFYEETRLFAYMFGIPDAILPRNWDEFMDYNRSMWNSDQLAVTDATRELAAFLFDPLHVVLTPAMYWLKVVTAATLPPRLREEFRLPWGQRERFLFEQGRRVVSLAEPLVPAVLRYGPSYVEAKRRLQGKSSTLVTRALTKATLGRSELVGMNKR